MLTAPVDSCQTCAYADAHGWWGPGHQGTHCRGCHRSWTSRTQAHCVACHCHFSSANAAELHFCDGRGQRHRRWCDGRHGRPWAPRHVEPAVVPGLYQDPEGTWSTSPTRDPEALRARAMAARECA